MGQQGRVVIAIIVVAALFIVTETSVITRQHGVIETTTVGPGGGIATSADDQISVSFAPDELRSDTDVRVISDDRRVPLLPPGLIPIVPPFSISPEASGNHMGVVTLQYPELPATVNPESIVMSVISDDGKWEALETTVNTQTRTITATWPHFSHGAVWIPSPFDLLGDLGDQIVSGAGTGTTWAWDRVADARKWLEDNSKVVTEAVTAYAVEMMGGTTDAPSCENRTNDWRFTSPQPIRGLFALDGCAEERSLDGTWDVTIVNHMPVPYMVTLPEGVDLNWLQLLTAGYPLQDLLISVVELTTGRTMISGGQSLQMTVLNSAPASVNLEGYVDPFSMAVEIVLAAITVMTKMRFDAMTSELDVAPNKLERVLRNQVEAVAERLPDQRVPGEAPLLQQLIRDRFDTDHTAREQRISELTDAGLDPDAVNIFFTLWDKANCALSTESKASELVQQQLKEDVTVDGVIAKTQEFAQVIVAECFASPVEVGLSVLDELEGSVSEVVKAALEQMQSFIRLGLVSSLAILQAGTDVDYLSTNIRLDRT